MGATLDELDPDVREIARSLSQALLEQGAKATILTGSHARGKASPESDIDLFVVGDGPRERFHELDGRHVGVHWWTPEQVRQRMHHPPTAFIAAHAWRDGVVVDDPTGVAAELQQEAREWSWEKIAAQADAWTADELVGWAEYVEKLVRALEDDRILDAAAIRAQTAIRLSEIVAVARRVDAESENGLWEAISDAAGPEVGGALRAALAVDGEDVRASSTAAIRLFELVARELDALLDDEQRLIVRVALEAAA